MANGLINLQTDLKSLRYGSEKPYITKNIGQAPGSQIGLEVQSRIDDVSRIAQMLASKPGFKYLANEALLKQAEVQSTGDKAARANKSVAGAILSQIGGTILSTVKIVGSTIVQVPVNGTGTHFLKGFKTNTYLQNGTTSGFAKLFGAGGVEGAQYAINGRPVPGRVNGNNQNFGEQPDADTFLINPDILEKYGYNKPVDQYPAAEPNIPLPKNVDDRDSKERALGAKPIPVSPVNGPDQTTYYRNELDDSFSNDASKLDRETFVHAKDENKYKDQSRKKETFDPQAPINSTYLVQKRNLKTQANNVTKEARVNLGDQGARSDENKKKNAYWTTSGKDAKSSLEVDQINFQDIVENKINGNKEGRDLIKFRFHVVTPDTTRILYFRAFLDSFADNYSGQWNPVKYLGRAEDFQIYGGFQRKISLSFKIAAATRSEMEPLYKKMVYLASATAPTYASSGQFMRGTIVKLTLGDYVYELPGVLNSCNFTWNTEYPWEIALTEPENGGDSTMQELPMVLDCSIDFTPIHEFTPETGLKKYFTSGVVDNDRTITTFFDESKFGVMDTIQQEALNKVEKDKQEAEAKAEKEKQAAIDAEIAKQDKMEGVTIVSKRAFGPITEKQAARDAMKATTPSAAFNIPRTNFISNS